MSPRRVALNILEDVFVRRRSLDEAMARAAGFDALESRDRGFVRLLVSLVLKRAREVDAVLAALLHEPLSELRPASLLNILRLGAVQLGYLQTPAHAAVSTTVDLAAEAGVMHHKPLVNAVMRRLAAEGYPLPDTRDAARRNTPDWLWQGWVNDYGVETALEICAAHLTEAPVDITVRDSATAWAEKLNARLLPTGSLRLDHAGFVPDLPGFDAGAWWVQGAAAALPVLCMGDVRGKSVVDLCAAPGGKTAQLAAGGADVIAVDRSAPRMERLRENLQRLGLSAATVVADGAQWQPPQKVDAVLLDAPCTATGTIRHQPDVLWLKTPDDEKKLVATQRRLLENAARMLNPGGVLVYCTCSLQKSEGEAQVEWFLSQTPQMKRRALDLPALAGMLTEQGDLRLLPQHWKELGGVDGFFVSCLVLES